MDDLRAAVRSLRNSPTFTAVALTVLALGIGAASAIFSIVDAVVLRALPFEEHDRLVAVLEHDTRRPTTFGSGAITPQTYIDWRRMQESFEAMGAAGSWTYPLRSESGEPTEARGYRISWDFLPTLRVVPLLGRQFTSDDETFGQHRVVMLAYGFWQRRFGGAPDVLGKTIELNKEPFEIVGVLPRDFGYPVASDRPTELYTPITFMPDDLTRAKGNRNYNWTAVARLKPGVSIEQARDQMTRVTEALDIQYPTWGPGRRVRVIGLHEHAVGRARAWLLMLLGAVALVLLIACANVANLLLARATTRAREMGVRAALGATRWRLARGLLIEASVLAFAAAAIGILLAYGGVGLLRAWIPPGVPRVADIGIDVRVLGTTVAIALLTGVTFGLVPALQSTRSDLTTALKDTGRSTTASRGTQRLRGALVVGEIALAVVLLVGAGLFIGSFMKLLSVDIGFDYHRMLALNVNVNVVDGRFDLATKQGAAYINQMLEAVRSVPGVIGAEAVNGGMPIAGGWSRTSIQLPSGVKFDGDHSIDRRTVTPGYLALLKVPLRKGRYVTTDDRPQSPLIAVINETAAAKYWPGRDPIGERFTLNSRERTVVGVVADLRHLGPEQAARPETYLPLSQEGTFAAMLAIRTADDPLALLPSIKTAIWSINKEQRLSAEILTLEASLTRMLAQRRFNMALLALFGGLGLLIAAVGIYGVMAYIVAQRTGEIGVRMALGATRGNVMSMVLGRASGLTGLGLVLGIAIAWPLTRYFEVKSYLFQTEPTDVGIYALALMTLAAASLVASVIPAHKAASIGPLHALRHD
jgi:putative ABC transport system permease protein